MAKTFSFNVKSTPEELFQILKKTAENTNGIEFTGNEKAGAGKGKGFEGSYKMQKKNNSNQVDITITKKPRIIPWSLIETKLSKESAKW